MKKTLIIIQARMGSRRLPGKVLKKICGESMLKRVVKRCEKIKDVDEIIVATTEKKADEPIIDACQEMGIPSYRGSENDVLLRYLETSIQYDGDIIVRFCADSPLIDPEVSDQVISEFKKELPNIDFCCSHLPKTFPLGLDVQVFSQRALERAHRLANKAYQRSHVTAFIYEHPEIFKIKNISSKIDYSHMRWTVDTKEDLDFVREIYKRLKPFGEDFSWKDVIKILDKNQALMEINSSIEQKELTLG